MFTMQCANDSHSNGTVKGAGEKEYWKGKGHAMHSEIYTPMLLLTPSMAMTELVKISSKYELCFLLHVFQRCNSILSHVYFAHDLF